MNRRSRWAALAFTAAMLLAACSGSTGPSGPAPSAPPGGAVIVAHDLAFDRTELAVPAGRTFSLLFENRDGAPHNVTIYDDGGTGPLFVGEIFGSGARTYQVPAIPAGTHRFRCDVHPEMSGTILASEA